MNSTVCLATTLLILRHSGWRWEESRICDPDTNVPTLLASTALIANVMVAVVQAQCMLLVLLTLQFKGGREKKTAFPICLLYQQLHLK